MVLGVPTVGPSRRGTRPGPRRDRGPMRTGRGGADDEGANHRTLGGSPCPPPAHSAAPASPPPSLTLVPAAVAVAGRRRARSRRPVPARPGRAAGRDAWPMGRRRATSSPQSPRPPITFPIAGQPVEGFSGIVAGRRPGEYLAMPDNGFGGKANVARLPDPRLLRHARLQDGARRHRHGRRRRRRAPIAGGDFVQFSDPDRRIAFPLVRADRLLTGGDIDPESIQRDHRGDLWVGDEFGPWILHFDAERPSARAADRAARRGPALAEQPAPGRHRGRQQPRPRGDGDDARTASSSVSRARGRADVRRRPRSPGGSTGTTPSDGTFTRLADYRVTATTTAAGRRPVRQRRPDARRPPAARHRARRRARA